jgi:hypothetical protein
VDELPDPMLSRAVLIGGCHYRKLAPLAAVHNNLTVLAKELCASDIWGLPADNCVTVEDPATPAEMLDPVVEAADQATDTLLLYYAGHGLVDRRGVLHLALVESESDTHLMYKAVPYDHIRDVLLESRAARRIVILDCCYSGRALGQMAAASSAVADQAEAEGTYVLAASAENKSALAPPGKEHTAFTGELLGIIKNGITVDDPLLDLDSIYRQLLRTTKTKGFPEPQKRDRNTAGQLRLIRNRAYQPPAVAWSPAADHYDTGLGQTTDQGSLMPVAPLPDADHYDMVLQQIIGEGSLVLFLGARSDELAAKLTVQFGLNTRLDLPDIAQTIHVTRGEPDLYQALRQILVPGSEPGPVHRFLARLPGALEELGFEKRYQLIVSTDFDMALTEAFDAELEPYDLAVYMASGPDTGKFVHFPYDGSPRPVVQPNSYTKFPIGGDYELGRTLIVKPYGAADGSIGDYRWTENYVITRDQYLKYLTRSPIEAIFPVQILDKLQDSHCLFLDCPARDWWQHTLLDRVWGGSRGAGSWAVEPNPDQFERDSWARANVDLYAADLAQYVDQLHKQLILLAKRPSILPTRCKTSTGEHFSSCAACLEVPGNVSGMMRDVGSIWSADPLPIGIDRDGC